jgi:hypothetical protein
MAPINNTRTPNQKFVITVDLSILIDFKALHFGLLFPLFLELTVLLKAAAMSLTSQISVESPTLWQLEWSINTFLETVSFKDSTTAQITAESIGFEYQNSAFARGLISAFH